MTCNMCIQYNGQRESKQHHKEKKMANIACGSFYKILSPVHSTNKMSEAIKGIAIIFKQLKILREQLIKSNYG